MVDRIQRLTILEIQELFFVGKNLERILELSFMQKYAKLREMQFLKNRTSKWLSWARIRKSNGSSSLKGSFFFSSFPQAPSANVLKMAFFSFWRKLICNGILSWAYLAPAIKLTLKLKSEKHRNRMFEFIIFFLLPLSGLSTVNDYGLTGLDTSALQTGQIRDWLEKDIAIDNIFYGLL